MSEVYPRIWELLHGDEKGLIELEEMYKVELKEAEVMNMMMSKKGFS